MLFLLKPKLKISANICREEIGEKIIYKIKVVNKSRVMLTNVRYSLFYHKDLGHEISELTKISPRKELLDYIDKYNSNEKKTDYAVRITYDYNEKLYPLENGNYLEFVVFAEHSFSNKGKCFRMSYTSKNLDKGRFEIGKSTRIS